MFYAVGRSSAAFGSSCTPVSPHSQYTYNVHCMLRMCLSVHYYSLGDKVLHFCLNYIKGAEICLVFIAAVLRQQIGMYMYIQDDSSVYHKAITTCAGCFPMYGMELRDTGGMLRVHLCIP